MTSITQALPAVFELDQSHAAPALFVRYAAAARPLVMASAAISSMSLTLTVSGRKRETHLLKNKSDIHKEDEIKDLFPKKNDDPLTGLSLK